MDAQRIYNELHKQLARKQLNPLAEVLFFTWCYLSANPRFQLPERLSIKAWINSFYSQHNTEVAIKSLFTEIQDHIPALDNSLLFLYEAHVSRFNPEVSNWEWELYASVFSRFPYEEASQQDWQFLLNTIIDDIVRKQKNLDPPDLSRLAATVFAKLLPSVKATSPKNKKTVFIPAIGTGVLAVSISEKSSVNFKYVGAEQDLESYCLAVITFLFYDLDTSGLVLGNLKEDLRGQQWDYFISSLKPAIQDSPEQLEKMFRVITLNSNIAIVIISQSFLFANKYKMIRRYLLYDGSLSAIISLAPNMYANTRVKSAMLVFNKDSRRDGILLVNGESLGAGNKRVVKYTEADIELLADIASNKIERDGLSKLFQVQDLRNDDFSLVVTSRLPEEKPDINLKEVRRRIASNQEKLIGSELTIQDFFDKLLTNK